MFKCDCDLLVANEFYRQRITEHLKIGLETVHLLRELLCGVCQSCVILGVQCPQI